MRFVVDFELAIQSSNDFHMVKWVAGQIHCRKTCTHTQLFLISERALVIKSLFAEMCDPLIKVCVWFTSGTRVSHGARVYVRLMQL